MHRGSVIVGAAAIALLFGASSVPAKLEPGAKLDQSTSEQARDLLPPEILNHYKNGEAASPIGEIKAPFVLDDSVLAATAKNEGRFAIDENGSLVEAATGKIPEYSFGLPFPKLDPKDPQIAQKVIWNFEYAYWSNGSNQQESLLTWLAGGSKAVERQIRLESMALVIEGNRHRQENPQQLSRLDRSFMLHPADINGMATLGWRFKDPKKRDSMWAYVPGLRRVRAVSPANRSDGVMGSEMTQDDGFNGFDAKPEDFTYSLVGMGEQYMSFVPEALDGTLDLQPGLSGQGWHVDTPEQHYGFRDPAWTGLPWHGIDAPLVARPVWVVDAMPTDKYYLFGKIRLFIDRDTYKMSIVTKYDWKGEAVSVFQRAISYGQAPDGYRYVQVAGGGQGTAYSENLRMNRATAGEPSMKGAPNEVDAKLDFDLFQQEKLVQMGR